MNFAIIGCGLIGKKRAATLRAHTIRMACDIDLIKANDIGAKLITNDWLDAVTSKNVDVVIVSTTNDLLMKITKEAIKNGKYVLVEKPAARNRKEFDGLSVLQITKKIKVGFNLRYHPAIKKAKEMVDAGYLGDLMFVRGRYGHGGRLGYEKEWRFNKEISGGGELIDQGVHLIDLSQWFLGNFSEINGDIKTYFWDTKLDDNAFLNLETIDGKKAWLHVSCTEWKNTFCFEIYGKKGKLQIDGLGGSYGKERLTFYKMNPDLKPPETTIWEFNEDTSWQDEMDDFIKCIEENKYFNGSGFDAYCALKIVDKVYKR